MNKRESHVGKFAKNSLFGLVAMHFMDMQEMVFCYQNCSDLSLFEKIVLVIKKNF